LAPEARADTPADTEDLQDSAPLRDFVRAAAARHEAGVVALPAFDRPALGGPGGAAILVGARVCRHRDRRGDGAAGPPLAAQRSGLDLRRRRQPLATLQALGRCVRAATLRRSGAGAAHRDGRRQRRGRRGVPPRGRHGRRPTGHGGRGRRWHRRRSARAHAQRSRAAHGARCRRHAGSPGVQPASLPRGQHRAAGPPARAAARHRRPGRPPRRSASCRCSTRPSASAWCTGSTTCGCLPRHPHAGRADRRAGRAHPRRGLRRAR
jgi:hypothetical protein